MESAHGDITVLLTKWRDGEPGAFEHLMPLVYPHLRHVAAAYIRRERDPGLMQATSLVHELYFKLVNQRNASWQDREHFYTFAARAMRMILIDHARGNHAHRRGGAAERVALNDEIPWVDIGSPQLLELNRALDALALLDPQKVKLVELRYFLGCTAEETAALLNISKATVDRDLKFIRTWLYRRMEPQAATPTNTD